MIKNSSLYPDVQSRWTDQSHGSICVHQVRALRVCRWISGWRKGRSHQHAEGLVEGAKTEMAVFDDADQYLLYFFRKNIFTFSEGISSATEVYTIEHVNILMIDHHTPIIQPSVSSASSAYSNSRSILRRGLWCLRPIYPGRRF